MMNSTNLLLMDRPIINAGKSMSFHSKNRNFAHRSNFHSLLTNQADSRQKNTVTNFSNGIRQLKKLLNQIDSPSEEVISIIDDLKTKLLENTSLAELVEFDESFIHKLLLAFVGNDLSFIDEEITEEQIFQLIDELILNDLDNKVEEMTNYHSAYLIIEPAINELSEEVQIQLQQ